jgi:hypothetical protein
MEICDGCGTNMEVVRLKEEQPVMITNGKTVTWTLPVGHEWAPPPAMVKGTNAKVFIGGVEIVGIGGPQAIQRGDPWPDEPFDLGSVSWGPARITKISAVWYNGRYIAIYDHLKNQSQNLLINLIFGR